MLATTRSMKLYHMTFGLRIEVIFNSSIPIDRPLEDSAVLAIFYRHCLRLIFSQEFAVVTKAVLCDLDGVEVALCTPLCRHWNTQNKKILSNVNHTKIYIAILAKVNVICYLQKFFIFWQQNYKFVIYSVILVKDRCLQLLAQHLLNYKFRNILVQVKMKHQKNTNYINNGQCLKPTQLVMISCRAQYNQTTLATDNNNNTDNF